MIDRDDARLLAHLVAHEIPFVVIGGWAVIAHGVVRFTADVDVLVRDDDATRGAVTRALAALSATTVNGVTLRETDAMPDQGWQVNTPLGRIDVLLEGPPPLDLDSVRAEAIATVFDGVPIHVAGLGHLGAFKRLAGRPRDREDLAELEALHGPLPVVALPGDDVDEP